MSRLRVLRSEEEGIESMAEDSALLAGLEQEDPQALAHFMRKMSDETGEPLDGEMDEVVGRLESERARSRLSLRCQRKRTEAVRVSEVQKQRQLNTCCVAAGR